jgi:hypothetical protein
MNLETGTETPQFPEKEYINGIFVAVQYSVPSSKEVPDVKGGTCSKLTATLPPLLLF